MSATLAVRNARVDLLRGIAILLVLLLHFHLSYGLHQSPVADWLPRPLWRALLINGNFGVTMFFAISGFLITRNALARWGGLGRIDWAEFYTLRIARILPPLLAALAVIVPFGLAGHPSFANLKGDVAMPAAIWLPAAGSVLTFWHNLLMQDLGYFNYALNVYWSLSVEEVFYLAFPPACLLLRRQRWILALCALLIVIGPLYRARHADHEIFFMYGYWACFDAIALGVAAALLAPRLQWSSDGRRWIQAGMVALLVLSFWLGIHGHEVFGFSQVALATATLLLFAHGAGAPGRLLGSVPARGLRWLGRHSYELYLFHIIVLGFLRALLPHKAVAPAAKLLWLLVFLAVSMAVAALVARLYAGPANRWLRHHLGRLRRRLPAQPA